MTSLSFRLIYMLLCGTASMPQALERLSDLSLSIVRATAEYLLCFEVVRAIDDMVAKKMDHQVIILDEAKQRESELRRELKQKCEEMDVLKAKASFQEVMEKLLSSRVRVKAYCCNTRRTHRPRNICGAKLLTVGDCVSPICEYCSEPMNLVKKTIDIPDHILVDNIAELEDLFKSFN